MFDRTKRTTQRTFRYVKDDVLNVKEAQGHFQDIRNLAREHMDPRLKKNGKRQETFANAVERLNLSPEDIAASYKSYNFRFYVFSFFGSMAMFLGIWSAIQGSWLGSLSSVGAMMVCVGQAFNASFRCFQIRHHELFSVREWWNAKSEWFPAEYLPPKSKSRSLSRK